MLYLETVESSTLELLKKLQRLPVLEQTRLVGGTALALQLGHRKSIDLDFFGTVDCEAERIKMIQIMETGVNSGNSFADHFEGISPYTHLYSRWNQG